MKLIFLYADKHEYFLQIDTIILIGRIKHSQSFQNSWFEMFLRLKKKSSQLRIEFIFCMQINIKGIIVIFDGSGQTCPKSPKYFYCDTKHSDILQGSGHVHCYFYEFLYIFPPHWKMLFLMFVRGLVVSYIFYLQLKSSLYIENCNKEHTKEDFA